MNTLNKIFAHSNPAACPIAEFAFHHTISLHDSPRYSVSSVSAAESNSVSRRTKEDMDRLLRLSPVVLLIVSPPVEGVLWG